MNSVAATRRFPVQTSQTGAVDTKRAARLCCVHPSGQRSGAHRSPVRREPGCPAQPQPKNSRQAFHQGRTRLLYQANHFGQFSRRKTDITRYRRHRLQPNFHGSPRLVHVDVRRLVGFVAVEIEPIAANSKNGRHPTAPVRYSAASWCTGAGRQRNTGFRAAAVSSRRRRGVRRGAARKADVSPAPALQDWARSARPRRTDAN